MAVSRGLDKSYAGMLARSRGAALSPLWPGIAACVIITLIASALGDLLPLIGAPVFAILLGIAAANALSLPDAVKPGASLCSRKLLQGAIIVLGGSLSLSQVYTTGRDSAAVMLVTLSVSLLGAWVIGRRLGIRGNLISLVGVGTGICGGSAIAAVAPIINADDDEIAFSISTIFLFNVAAVVLFPLLGHLMRMNAHAFGLWAGTAINDTSSVVAAGYSYSHAAGDYAAITKLARTTMIVPVCLAFAFLARRTTRRRPAEGAHSGRIRMQAVVPWFIFGFFAASLINTTGVFGPSFGAFAGSAGKCLIIVALAGVGLSADLSKMVKTGARPILLGLLVWGLVALSSLAMQVLLHQI